jgi:hypothetical protein
LTTVAPPYTYGFDNFIMSACGITVPRITVRGFGGVAVSELGACYNGTGGIGICGPLGTVPVTITYEEVYECP